MNDESAIDLTADVTRRKPVLHRWWARRGEGASMAVVLLTQSPEFATDVDALREIAANPSVRSGDELDGVSLLDLCAGSCTVAAAASRLGASATAIDNHPIPVLIGKGTLVYPAAYGRPELAARGSGPRSTWAGLAHEVAHWSEVLLERTMVGAGDLWLAGIDGVIASRRFRCSACGLIAGAAPSDESSDLMYVHRGLVRCPSCGATTPLRNARAVGFELKSMISNRERVPLSDDVRSLLESAAYPPAVQESLDDPFVFSSHGPILTQDAVTPRQAQVIRAAQAALRSVRDSLADDAYAPEHARAIVTYLALSLSGLVDRLSTFTRWDDRQRRALGVNRQDWSPPIEFIEIGGNLLQGMLAQRFTDVLAVIESNSRPADVDVRPGDMTALSDRDASFDLVIWDPPFYDNIAYDRVSLPWTRFLRTTIGDLDPSLPWPSDPTVEDRPPRFDREEYETDLRRAAAEVSRVLRPGGRLGVFWITRTGQEVADLSDFLDMLEPTGLEMVQSFTLKTEVGAHDNADKWPRSLLLVFRRTPAAQPSDAAAVLQGEQHGLPMKVAGLVELLERHLDDDELSDIIPKGFRGQRSEQLAEAVLAEPDPREPLRLLSKRALKEYAHERGCSPDELGDLDRTALARLVFNLLGWREPREAVFTVGKALDEVVSLTSRLRLGGTEDEIRGRAGAALDRIEQVVRFTVVSWATRLGGDQWIDRLDQVVDKRGHLTFGDWFGALRDLPQQFATEDGLVGHAGSRIRKLKVLPVLEAALASRNDLAHPEDDVDWLAMRDEVAAVLDRAIERLRAADAEGALPRVLQPVEEVRDPYGRITLRLLAHGQTSVEFLMTELSDLTQPLILLTGPTNPREVDPARLDAATVFERAGVG